MQRSIVQMKEYAIIRKSESVTRLIILVFFGIAIHSLIIITPILNSLNNSAGFLTLEIFVVYLVVSFGYSALTSWYVTPNMVISPFYIQLGTASFIGLAFILHLIVSGISVISVMSHLSIMFMEFSFFVAFGFGISIFLRKMVGMYGNEENIWNKTYRIEANYNLIKKKIFDDLYFARYRIDRSEENNVITASRKFSIPSEIRILIFLQVNPKSPDESLLSISTCEIKFESLWKTENAKRILTTVTRVINGVLFDNYSVSLILEEGQSVVSSKCNLTLLESMQSPLSQINKTPRKPLSVILGLLGLGIAITILPFISLAGQATQINTETSLSTWVTIATTWVTIATTIVYLLSPVIKAKFRNNTE